MKFLLDSNCWMQLIRARENADAVRNFLVGVPPRCVFVSSFALHSIGVVMLRHGILDQYADFIANSGIVQDISVVSVEPLALRFIAESCHRYHLDFDDAYQYVAAELNDLFLVSLDADFDRTPRGRLTPAAALQKYKDEKPKPTQEA